MDFIVISIPAHNQEIGDDTANYQTDRNEPESTHQQKQDSLNCGANGKHAFFGTLASRSIITIPFGIATTDG